MAMIAIGLVVLLKKNVFKMNTRSKFSMVDLPGLVWPLVKSFITVLLVRYLIKLVTLLAVTKGNAVAGFSFHPLSVFATTEQPLKKWARILTLILPYVLITIVSLCITKNLRLINRTYYWILMPYLNAAFSCGNLYTAFLIAFRTPKGSSTVEWKARYFASKEVQTLKEDKKN